MPLTRLEFLLLLAVFLTLAASLALFVRGIATLAN